MSIMPTNTELAQKIADLERQNQELKKYKTIFQSVHLGMAVIDFSGIFLDVNKALCAAIGYTREELLEMQAIDLEAPGFHTEFRKSLDSLHGQEPVTRETIYLHKNSTPIPCELSISVVQLEGKSGVLLAVKDITARKKQENTLRCYERVFSVTKDLVAFIDEDYIYQMVNDSYLRDHGKKREEIVGHSVFSLHGERGELLHTVKSHIDRCLSGETVRYQAWFEYPGVGRRYRDITCYPHRLADKSVTGVFVVAHDLTYLKLAQEAQQAKHNLLSHILNHMPSGVYVVNKTYDILFSNPALEKDFGPVANRKCFEAIAGRKSPCSWCENEKVFAGETVQWEWKAPKTGKVYVGHESLLQNTEYGLSKVTFLMDITLQRKVENDLRDYNELLLALINASPDIICFKDGSGRWLLANETELQLFQLTGVDYKGKTDAELARYTEFYRQALMTCMESDEETWTKGQHSVVEEVVPTPDGGYKIFEVVKIPLFQPGGERNGLVVLGHDITERINTEEKLRFEIDARRQSAQILEQKSKEAEEANIALRVLVNQQQNSVEETQQNVLIHLKQAVFPYVELLRQSLKGEYEKEYLDIMASNLRSVGTSYIKKLSDPDLGLTKKELLVADLVRQGKSTKEIALLLSLQIKSVEAYRNKIRKKLDLSHKKISLKHYLSSTFTSES